MSKNATWALSVDPGGQTTGLLLCRLRDGVITPVDGVSFQRLAEERDTDHRGEPNYVRRLFRDGVYAMLDKHGVGDEGLMVCVETLVPPRPMPGSKGHMVPMAVWRGLFCAHAAMGAVCAVFGDDVILVAPDGHDLKKLIYPAVLRGRRPAAWMAGSSERQHQRAAFSIMLAGLTQAGIAYTVAPDGAPPVGVAAADLAAAIAAIRLRLKSEKSSLELLVSATFTACHHLTGEQLVDCALAATEEIKPSRDPIALRARLSSRLDSFAADSLI